MATTIEFSCHNCSATLACDLDDDALTGITTCPECQQLQAVPRVSEEDSKPSLIHKILHPETQGDKWILTLSGITMFYILVIGLIGLVTRGFETFMGSLKVGFCLNIVPIIILSFATFLSLKKDEARSGFIFLLVFGLMVGIFLGVII